MPNPEASSDYPITAEEASAVTDQIMADNHPVCCDGVISLEQSWEPDHVKIGTGSHFWRGLQAITRPVRTHHKTPGFLPPVIVRVPGHLGKQ
jgi:hypothetical protein